MCHPEVFPDHMLLQFQPMDANGATHIQSIPSASTSFDLASIFQRMFPFYSKKKFQVCQPHLLKAMDAMPSKQPLTFKIQKTIVSKYQSTSRKPTNFIKLETVIDHW